MYDTPPIVDYARPRLPVVLSVIASLPVFGFQVGTGGAATMDYFKQRGCRGYAFAPYDCRRGPATPVASRSPAEDLAHVRAVLQPAVTDLAKALSVSRQALYDWQAGKPIAAENAARLADLARAADIFAFEGLTTTGQLLRRPISEGKNLFEFVREGRSAEAAARTLIHVIRQELRQREALRTRLAGRPRPSRDAYEDIGAPMLDEGVPRSS
jgi:hypothetical protein